MLFIENNEGVKSASLFFVGQMFLYVKRNERLHQKVAHAESYISDKMKTPPVHRVMISHDTLTAFLRYEGRNIQILH